jgi:hypothetical protein
MHLAEDPDPGLKSPRKPQAGEPVLRFLHIARVA